METVLQGVLDSARLLVGARCGLIYLVSSQGRIEENVYSGITSEQARQLWEMPHAVTFQSHVDELEETFRIPDLHSHIAAVGLPEFQPPFPVNPVMPLLAVSILYRGDRVGAIYLGDKEPSPTAAGDTVPETRSRRHGPGDTVPEFTARDQNAISMLAAQAALVISKARIHREEHRARTRFETLLNTTPVGVRSTPLRWECWSSSPSTLGCCTLTGKQRGCSATCSFRAGRWANSWTRRLTAARRVGRFR